jgi:C1A family cysteine protease
MTQSTPKTPIQTPVRAYGWHPDLPDKRDLYRRFVPQSVQSLPPKVDLRPKCPAVYDQGRLGSCTANAIGAAHQFEQIRQAGKKRRNFVPSRLFIYWNERSLEGTISEDAGAYIRDGIKSLVKWGVCPETEWPYVESRFAVKPSTTAFIHAAQHQALKYQRLDQNLQQLRACLASGHPFVFGFTVYESFESKSVAKVGIIPMPGPGERSMGGHAVLCVGYDDESKYFIVRNSWGASWGDKGHCHMPYAYLADSDLSADFWTVTLVETDSCNKARRLQ